MWAGGLTLVINAGVTGAVGGGFAVLFPRVLGRNAGRSGSRGVTAGWLPWVVAAWLFGIGLYGIVTSRHYVHLIGCLAVVQSATYVLLLSIGYRHGAGPPFFHPQPPGTPAVDPVVSGPRADRHRRRRDRYRVAVGAGAAIAAAARRGGPATGGGRSNEHPRPLAAAGGDPALRCGAVAWLQQEAARPHAGHPRHRDGNRHGRVVLHPGASDGGVGAGSPTGSVSGAPSATRSSASPSLSTWRVPAWP